MCRVTKTVVVVKRSSGEWTYELFLNGEFDCWGTIPHCSDSASAAVAIEVLREEVPVCASAEITVREGSEC